MLGFRDKTTQDGRLPENKRTPGEAGTNPRFQRILEVSGFDEAWRIAWERIRTRASGNLACKCSTGAG
jgi:hypothetical protein